MSQPIATAFVEILPDFSGFVTRLRREITIAMKQLEREADSAFSNVENSAEHAGRTISISITIGAHRAERAIDDLADSAHHDFNRIERDAAGAGRSIATAASASAFSELLGVLGQVGSAFSGSGFPLLIAGIAALLPAILALAAALADLIGLVGILPAGLSVLLAAILPVVIAFQNFGEAVTAINEGDPQKIAEALKKLSPAAQDVAKQFATMTGVFEKLQKTVQQSFFAELNGQFNLLAAGALPQLTAGLAAVAGAAGRIASSFIWIVTSTKAIEIFQNILATTARILDRFAPTIVRVFEAVLNTVQAGLPFIEELSGSFAGLLERFAGFVNVSIENGTFDAFVKDALATVGQLIDLLKALGSLVGTIFASFVGPGHELIDTLTDVVTRLDDFFKSAEGQRSLEEDIALIKAAGAALGFLINFLIEATKFSLKVEDAFKSLGNSLQSGGDSIGNFFTSIGTFFSSLPGKIGEALSALPGVIGGAFTAAFDAAFTAVGLGIGLILFAILELPKQAGEFLSTMPGKLGDALANTGPVLSDLFSRAVASVKGLLIGGFDEVVAFINSVPGRIAALGPFFLQAGINLIQSFMEGFRRVGTFIGDVAGDIVNGVKGFLNRAIDRINNGIGIIDDLLPGSLPRIPRLAKGGIIPATPGGRLFVGGEGGQDEVVAPLSKLKDMLNAGPQIVFGPGSINVGFEGVIPTEQQAFTTGQAVGQGVLAALARRDIRMQARAA